MAKYDTQLGNLKEQLAQAGNILIALPQTITVDKLASALALMLSLKAQGKSAAVVTQDTVRVSHTNLYGVGEVKDKVEAEGDGNFIITLEGVVDTSTNTVPSLEKLDWYPEGGNLNLVFHPVPGQKFEPINISHKSASTGGKVDLVFVLGAPSLNDLGNIYAQNQPQFNTTLVNIDNNPANSNFGAINIVDGAASSLAEMLTDIMQPLGLNVDQDMAGNLLNGIYDATGNLTQNINPDTFQAAAKLLQLGGRLPVGEQAAAPVSQAPAMPVPEQQPVQAQPEPKVQPEPQVQPQAEPQQPQPEPQPEPQIQPAQQSPVGQSGPIPTAQGFDLREVFQIPPTAENYQSAPAVSSSPAPVTSGSTQEVPQGEIVQTQSQEADSKPAPDWLTPKIYKGGSLG
jgi:hypothetical protein